MPTTRRQFAATVTAAVPAAFATKLIGADADIRRPDDRFFRTRLTALLDVTAVPGFAAGVMRDGKPMWERYQGVMEAGTKRHIAAETLFPRVVQLRVGLSPCSSTVSRLGSWRLEIGS